VKEIETAAATYAVCNVGGTVHCLEGTCPHAGGPLGQGALNENYIVCPWHEYQFDCRTGVNDFDEDMQVETYPVIVQDGQILIDIP
jgi:nitrite reductase/ring-hydroxylating ferredoxin subunit